jgi:prepilin-type N-terminal cleavage/methylation domain-containing protein
MQGASLRRFARNAAGFTLLELAVVMMIMGLVIMLAVPYLGSLGNAQLKSETRRLASRANYLYEEAAAQKVMLRLVFDLDHNGYFVMRFDPFAAKPAIVSEPGLAGVRAMMPPGVRIRDVWVEGVGRLRKGSISCQFYPTGYVDATVVHMTDARGVIYTLSISPTSGQVAITNKDLDPPAALAMNQ